MRRVTIVGGSAAGMGAAYKLLQAGYDVTLVEARDELGGSCFGVDVPTHDGGTFRVDGGVCDYNRTTSPSFDAFLGEIGAAWTPIVDDAAFMTPAGETVWYERRGRPRFQEMSERWPAWLTEIERFEREAPEVLSSLFYVNWTVERYLESRGYSEDFRRLYLYPRTAGCLPMLEQDPAELPMRALVIVWRMTGILDRERAERLTLDGGLHRYGAAFARWFVSAGGRLLRSWRAIGASRDPQGTVVRVLDRDGSIGMLETDDLVLATRPDLAIDLLDDATAAERLLAASCVLRHTRVVVHQDARLMPRDRTTWGAFNYPVECDGAAGPRPAVTLYPNLLEALPAEVPDVFVTINPHREPSPEKVLDERMRIHPAPGQPARDTARLVAQIQGRRRTWFCGSYFREPFLPEQALRSGFDVAERIRDHRVTPYADSRLGAAAG